MITSDWHFHVAHARVAEMLAGVGISAAEPWRL
jgi:hypothetical protein